MKNRGKYITTFPNENCPSLPPEDISEIISSFSEIKTDLVLQFILHWAANRDANEFQKTFRNKFYDKINWQMVSKSQMKQIHDLKLLSPDQENECLMTMMSVNRKRNPVEKEMILKSSTEFKLRVKQDVLYLNQIVFRLAKWMKSDWCAKLKEQPLGSSFVNVEAVGNAMMKKLFENETENGINVSNIDVSDISLEIYTGHVGKYEVKIPISQAFALSVMDGSEGKKKTIDL